MSGGGPSVRDHVSACGLEMISLFALLYFLKTLLHFDVFGQSLQQVPQRDQHEEKNYVKEKEVNEEEKEVKEEEKAVKEVEEDGEEEDDDYNEDTVEKSYSVSSWSGLCSAPSHTEEEEEEEGEEGETDITNVTGGSRCEDDHHEEIIDEIPAEHDGPDKTQISEEDQDESRDETGSDSECDSDQISDCEAIYSTDWYNHYKQIIKQKSASVTGQDAER